MTNYQQHTESKTSMNNNVSALPKAATWFVYIARAHTGRYYVGMSPDSIKRLDKHNLGIGSQFARDQGPFVLVYTSPSFPNKSAARKREIQLKGWSRAKKEKLIAGEWQ